MDNLAAKYCADQIGFTGFVLASAGLAARLRPDLFGSAQQALGLYDDLLKGLVLFNVQPYQVTFVSGETAECWSKTKKDLSDRIEYLTGLEVLAIEPITKTEKINQKPFMEMTAEMEKVEKIRGLKKTAAENLPLHDCPNRRVILAAREELQRLGERYE
jgi:hypothetical protein